MPDGPRRILSALRDRGAAGLLRVRLRANRTVLWSLTDRGRTLNLHEAYGAAPDDILDALALLVREGPRRTDRGREAAERVRGWPPVGEAIRRIRGREVAAAQAAARSADPELERGWGGGVCGAPGCVANPVERGELRTLYRQMNHERLGGLLPDGIPLRVSGRMSSRLGHMRPGTGAVDERVVVEIALNRTLFLPANRALLEDTLLHEMAHAADWLVHGKAGHGPTWRAWARRVGCHPRACSHLPLRSGTEGRGRKGVRKGRRP